MKRMVCSLVAFALVVCMAPVQIPAQELPGQEPKVEDDPRLVAIGGGYACAIYLAFVNIGMSGDAFAKGLYDAKKIEQIAGEIKTLSGNMAKLLKDVDKNVKMAQVDVDSLNEMVTILGLLQEYADSLIQYTKTKTQADADKFQENRTKTWARIKTMLGIK